MHRVAKTGAARKTNLLDLNAGLDGARGWNPCNERRQRARSRASEVFGIGKSGREFKKRFVGIARGSQLHSTLSARKSEGRDTGQAEGGRVAQQTDASLAVICACAQSRDGRGGKQQQLAGSEKIIHALLKACVPLTQRSDLISAESGAPLQPLANGRFKAVKMAGVKTRGLRGLNGSKDFERIRPPAGVEGRRF
jgi:hypothetical protein